VQAARRRKCNVLPFVGVSANDRKRSPWVCAFTADEGLSRMNDGAGLLFRRVSDPEVYAGSRMHHRHHYGRSGRSRDVIFALVRGLPVLWPRDTTRRVTSLSMWTTPSDSQASDLPRCSLSLLNRFRIGQGPYNAPRTAVGVTKLLAWRLPDYIVDYRAKFERGLTILHEAEDDAVNWLNSVVTHSSREIKQLSLYDCYRVAR